MEWQEVSGVTRQQDTQAATQLLAKLNEMRPADAATMIHDLPAGRRAAVVAALDDERLADVLAEITEEDQVESQQFLGRQRAPAVREHVSPTAAPDPTPAH